MIGKGTMKESNPNELIRETPEPQSFLDRMRLENTAPDERPDSIPPPSEMGGNFSSGAAQDPAADENGRQTHAAMPAEARRALVFLLRQGVILSAQKAKLFEAVCRHETRIRQHLSDVYLTLVLDEKSGVAFIAGMQSEHCQLAGDAVEAREDDVNEDEQYSLISRRVLPLYDTLLLLVLRKYYQSRELCGEQKIIVDIEKIESDLTPFLPLTNSARTDRRKLNGALQKMVSSRILSTVRGSLERFEITPIIRYVVSAEFLESMLKEYERLALEAEPSTAAPDPGIEQP
ncbi:MAG TPA: hypothetical protein DEB50_11205 [Desulfobacter sp.]|nr:hypothetical protein [Desulfobacter sp.]